MRFAVVALATLAALTACRRNKGAADAAGPVDVDQRVEAQAKAREPLAQRVGELYRGSASEDGEGGQWPLALEKGECYWVSAAGDDGVEEVEIELFEPEDDDRVESEKESPGAVMTYCPEVSGSYRVELTVTEGRGSFALGLYRKGTGEGVGVAPTDLGVAADAHAAKLAPEALRPKPHFTGKPPQGDWYFELVPGTCYWFVGVGTATVTKLSLELWSPKEERVAFSELKDGHVVVEHCAAVTGMFHLQAKGEGGGEFVVGQYEKPATMAITRP